MERDKSRKAAGYSWISLVDFYQLRYDWLLRYTPPFFPFHFLRDIPPCRLSELVGTRQEGARHSRKVIAPGNAKAWKLHVPPLLTSSPFPAAFHGSMFAASRGRNICTRRTRVLKLPSVTRLRDEHGRAHRSMDRAAGYAVWPHEEIKADNIYSEGSPRDGGYRRRWITPDVFLDIAPPFSIQTVNRRCVTRVKRGKREPNVKYI